MLLASKNFDFASWLRRSLPPISLLIVLVLISYFNSLDNDFVADDIPAILQNPDLGKLETIFKTPLGFVRPLVYFLSYQIGGLSPGPYHFFSLLFHLGTVLTVYLLLSISINSRVAVFSSSLFAVHPILTESVSWISGAVHSQYGFFLTLALLFYILSLKNKGFYPLSLISFLLALLSSEKAVIFPAILLALFFAEERGRRDGKKLIPFFLLGLLWIFLYLGQVPQRIALLETQYYQAKQILNPLLQIPIAVSSYLELILWPKNLTIYHSEMSFSSNQYLLRLTIFLGFLGLILYSWFKNRQIFFWFSFFLISLLPMLTPLGISWIVAERYVYFGSIGIFVVAGLAFEKLTRNRQLKPLVIGLFVFLLTALSLRTINRNMDWQNQDSLWLATAKTSPSSPQNHNNLGDYYGRKGDLDKAVEEFRRAIELQPNYGDAYHNLANTYGQMGKTDLAIENYKKALEFNPGLWQSHLNLGLIYRQLNLPEKADAEFQKAIELNPKLRENLSP